MSNREVMQQALDALELSAVTVDSFGVQKATQAAITALKAALEQPEQQAPFSPEAINTTQTAWRMGYEAAKAEQQAEPVAWMYDCGNGGRMYAEELDSVPGWMPLYTTPPQRKPLTDEEIHNLDPFPHKLFDQERLDFARAIEAAHGIEGEA